MSLLASIDIGSNTIRLLIGRIEGKRIVRLRTERVITRLAEGVAESGALKAANIEKSVSVLKEFACLISKYGVSEVKAVGTSALREARNAGEFADRVVRAANIEIEIISGDREAEITSKGILSFLDKIPESSLIIDIGGGSTEWVLCKHSNPVEMGTIPTGVVKLHENHIKLDPPSEDEIISLNREIGHISNILKIKIGDSIDSNTVFIGTAGTITTLASIDLGIETYSHERVHMHNINLQRLYGLSEVLTNASFNERRKIKGLEPERADLIIPGIHFTINLMEMFGFKSMLVSDYGLLEGVLTELSERDK